MIKNSLLLCVFIIAQFTLSAQNTDKFYEIAESQLHSGQFEEALATYGSLSKGAIFKDADYKLEICKHLSGNRDLAVTKMLDFGKTKGRADKFYNYWMGRIYLNKYEFEEAIKYFTLFPKQTFSKTAPDVEIIKRYLSQSKELVSFLQKTDNYEIHQLDGEINSSAAELSASFFPEKNELLFLSSRGSKPGNEVFKVYHSIKQKDGWSHISEISILGTFTRENANLQVVNEDGKLFVFNPKDGGDLFYSESRNGQWMLPVEFDSKVTSTHLHSHFFINEHEDRIIFSTDANAKTNGLDLYETFKSHKTGKWSKPAPFADIINSKGDEDSPFLSADEKRLYFCSNGHGGLGGFDVFVSTFDDVKLTWSPPVNLGFPINSPDNEVHFKMNPDGKSGYFGSNRLHSKGDYDIYFFWEIIKVKMEGRVYDALTQEPVKDAMIRFTPSAYSDEHFRSATDKFGKYNTEIISDEVYLVEVIVNNNVLFTDDFEIHDTEGESTTYIKDFVMNKPKLSGEIELFAFDESKSITINPSQVKPIVNNPEPTKTVVEEKPKADNIEPTKTETKPVVTRVVEPTKPKVEPQVVKPNEKPQTTTIQNLASYALGSKVIIHNVYFDFGTSVLSPTSDQILTDLLEVLKANPSMRVEIGGHTDNRGNKDANVWLSQRRSESVMKWLVNRGVPADRLSAKGYGSSQPIASNDDEESGRELNRRIEVRTIR